MRARFIFRIFRIIIPILLIAVIVRRVDLHEVKTVLLGAHLGYFAAGLLLGIVLQVVIGAWRWHYYLSHVYGYAVSYRSCLLHYWVGMFLGYFLPGGLGWDAYRAIVGNKMANGPLAHVTIVVIEKIVGLLACVLLILLSYPAVMHLIVSEDIAPLAFWGVVASAAGLLVLLLSVVCFWKYFAVFLRWFERLVYRYAFPIFKKDIVEHETDVLIKGIGALVKPRDAVALWGSSIALRFCMALGGWLFLQSLYVDVPIAVNIFVMPLTTIVFMLPISFGSIGVREGTFILLYGVFGVGSANALSASVLGLIALLITVGIGGFVMVIAGVNKNGDKKVI